MVIKLLPSKEYKKYKLLQHWESVNVIPTAEALCICKNEFYPLFLYLYQKTKELYQNLPARKNGEDSFIHPTNIVLALKEAHVNDIIILCGGLLHDYVEEEVDLYKTKLLQQKDRRLKNKKEEIKILDQYEIIAFERLRDDLITFCSEQNLEKDVVEKIIATTKLLTRHKRDFYYGSMCNIFTNSDEKIKEKVILIKLADRLHNILSIECFNKEERIYQCFKNLFILNSVKKYLLENGRLNDLLIEPLPPIGKLFKRCAKATYDAFLTICRLCYNEEINEVESMLQFAFKKFSLERGGAKEVTAHNKAEMHLMRLYRTIIKKYDLRLHHQWKLFEKEKKKEQKYCHKFFADYKFNDEQLQTIIDYKDAYALKEVVTYLLYLKNYTISGFEYTNLFCED